MNLHATFLTTIYVLRGKLCSTELVALWGASENYRNGASPQFLMSTKDMLLRKLEYQIWGSWSCLTFPASSSHRHSVYIPRTKDKMYRTRGNFGFSFLTGSKFLSPLPKVLDSLYELWLWFSLVSDSSFHLDIVSLFVESRRHLLDAAMAYDKGPHPFLILCSLEMDWEV